MRKTISIDFDGVIHLAPDPHYWAAPAVMKGRPNAEALRFIAAALDTGFDVVVHSCRFYDLGAVQAVREWIIDHLYPYTPLGPYIQCSVTKPRALIYIDDRGFKYEGRFPQLEDIK